MKIKLNKPFPKLQIFNLDPLEMFNEILKVIKNIDNPNKYCRKKFTIRCKSFGLCFKVIYEISIISRNNLSKLISKI